MEARAAVRTRAHRERSRREAEQVCAERAKDVAMLGLGCVVGAGD